MMGKLLNFIVSAPFFVPINVNFSAPPAPQIATNLWHRHFVVEFIKIMTVNYLVLHQIALFWELAIVFWWSKLIN